MKQSFIALASLGLVLVSGLPTQPAAHAAPYAVAAKAATGAAYSKVKLTPSFYQMDPTAEFDGNGSNFCAPTAVSNGLIYLAVGRGLEGLVEETDHDGQVALIKELAEHMETDPDQGTSPGQILNGVYSYMENLEYSVGTMEVAGWRPLGSDNEEFSIAKKPSFAWLKDAAKNPDTVVLLNVGWYKAEAGGYRRYGGHWVTVVGAGPGQWDLQVRNPAIRAGDQARLSTVSFTTLGNNAAIAKTPAPARGLPPTLAGYYKVAGPGLPHGNAITAVLDCAMVFTVEE
ncbi:MAG: hypothetical protein ACK46X_20045 [Candidatus Sericytochromatia bacterium]